eukprot:757002-Hanusia_phi.AAC.4
MGQSFCSPQGVLPKKSHSLADTMQFLKKAARPKDGMAPSVAEWYEEVHSILAQVEKQREGISGMDLEDMGRMCKITIATTKGVTYWVKEINEQMQHGVDGSVIAKASSARLERSLRPYVDCLKNFRKDFIESPCDSLAYYMMSMREP